MSLRFSSQLAIDNLPDEQTNDQFEVIMPTLYLNNDEKNRSEQASKENAPELAGNKEEAGFFKRVGQAFGSTYDTLSNSTKYQPIVEEIAFPQQGFITETRRVRTSWLNLTKDLENLHEVSITMFCPQDMKTQQYLQAWQNMIFNKEGEFYYSSQIYKRNIVVLQWGPALAGGLAGQHLNYTRYTLRGCFPKAQDDYKLAYSDKPNRFRIMATFCVDKITCDFSNSNTIPLLSTPTNIVGNVLEGIGNQVGNLMGTGENTSYTMQETY